MPGVDQDAMSKLAFMCGFDINSKEAVRAECEEGGCFLIVGLGNPGEAYARTKHNIGFRIVDSLACYYRIPMRLSECIGVRAGRGVIEGWDVILAEPMGYMNLSGEPVRLILMNTGLLIEDMIVVHDDMDLSFGRI